MRPGCFSYLAAAVVAAAIGFSAMTFGWAGGDSAAAPQTLVPQGAFLYVSWAGTDTNKEAWEKTAAYQSLEKSGLIGTLAKLAASYAPPDRKEAADSIRKFAERVVRQGFTVSLSFASDTYDEPSIMLVLHQMGKAEPELSPWIAKLFDDADRIKVETVRGRSIHRMPGDKPDQPEFAWWSEGGHLCLAAGKHVVDGTLDVAEGKQPSIQQGQAWKKFHDAENQPKPAFLSWIDVESLRKHFEGRKLEFNAKTAEHTFGDLFQALGVDKLGHIAVKAWFDGPAIESRITVEAPAPRTGILALFDQQPITLKDTAPLPEKGAAMVSVSLDLSKLFDGIVKIVRDVAALSGAEAQQEIDGFLAQMPQQLGFDLKKDLFDPLGHVITFYNDPGQGIFGFAPVIAFSVDDAEALAAGLKKVVQIIGDRGNLTATPRQAQGREVVAFDVGAGGFTPAYCVDKKWLVIALVPQSVDSFLMRVDGKLDAWKPSEEIAKTLEAMPKEFLMVQISDPRPTLSSITSLLPMALPALDAQLTGRQGIAPERIAILGEMPPNELLLRSLFPSVSIWTGSNDGFHERSRSSVPGLSLDGLSVGAMGGVGAALLLPAVQAARTAARSASFKNSGKQIMLGLHNYHDVNRGFPEGTHPNKALKVEERFSWIVDILPYLEQQTLHNSLALDKAWNDDANKASVKVAIPLLLNPGVTQTNTKEGYGVTHYVGVGGIGADGPNLPANSPKAGMFGYERATRIADITDGTSNSAAICEAVKEAGPWAAGGRPTIRSLTKKPYVNGPDGLGGANPRDFAIGFGDGSVRQISSSIDPKVLEAIMTINGGEAVNLP